MTARRCAFCGVVEDSVIRLFATTHPMCPGALWCVDSRGCVRRHGAASAGRRPFTERSISDFDDRSDFTAPGRQS